jgi:hypothetical protein
LPIASRWQKTVLASVEYKLAQAFTDIMVDGLSPYSNFSTERNELMKKTKLLHKTLSLSKETIRGLTGNQLGGIAGGFVVTSDAKTGELGNTCNTACKAVSCAVC